VTQSFFADLLARNPIAGSTHAGRFRSFLWRRWRTSCITMAVPFRSEARRRPDPISLDTLHAEQRYSAEPVERKHRRCLRPEWVRALLDKAIRDLHANGPGRAGDLSREFQAHLWGDATSVPYAELCARFDLTPVNLRVTSTGSSSATASWCASDCRHRGPGI